MSRSVTIAVCSTPATVPAGTDREKWEFNVATAERLLAIDGAEIIFHPTVYSMYGEVGWEAVLRARAIDNCLYVCPVNHGIGDQEPWMPGMCLGRASIVGPDGLTLADTGRYAGVAVATVDLDRPRMVRSMGVAAEANFREQMWKHRRPETYGKITDQGYWLRQEQTPDGKAGT